MASRVETWTPDPAYWDGGAWQSACWHWSRPGGTEHLLFFASVPYAEDAVDIGLNIHGGYRIIDDIGYNFFTQIRHGIVLKGDV